MQVARYWSKIESTARTPAGKFVPFICWRGSATSAADARTLALQAAERMAARIENGEGFPETNYAYADRPLREEILQEIPGGHGELAAVVTRNIYGAEVLNAARLLFIDVDLPEGRSQATGLLGWVVRALFGPRGASIPSAASGLTHEAEAHARRRQWVVDHPEWGMRVYRTRSGLRYLVTHALFDPGDAASETAMAFMGCDPAYRQLCRAQKSFRARLTPKAWRCGISRPPGRFPFESADHERQMRAWEDKYNLACQSWASCALLEVCGNPQVDGSAVPLLRIHDDRTRANTGLPLA